MKIKLFFVSCAVLFPSQLMAQEEPTVFVPAVSVPASKPVVIAVMRTGTAIPLRILQGITTKGKVARINDRVRMEVAEPVSINDVVIIPAGSPAVGELTEVKNKGMWGKSGRLIGRALTVNANGRTIRLSGTFDTKGGSGTAGAVAVSALVFAPAGFFMTGKSAELTTGTIVSAFIDEDVPFAVSSATPAPMMVGETASPVMTPES